MKTFALDLSERRLAPLLVLASSILATGAVAHAQSLPAPNPQAASQSNANAPQDQYTGVSKPPADDAIVTNDDSAPLPAAKPSPYVSQQNAAPPAVQTANTPQAAPVSNPDDDIVSSVPAQNAAAPAADMPVHLVSRPTDPGDGIVDMVPAGANQLAEGTNISVRLLQPLSTISTQDGQPFHAQVAADVYKDGRVVIPMGAELRGHVTAVSQGHRVGGHATLRLRPDYVLLPDGTAYHLLAEAISTTAPGTHTDDEGGIEASHHVVKDLAEYGGGAGGGAIVGAALGGPVGAGAGAIVGAGAVTTHMLLQKPAQASLETGTGVIFSLTEPMDLVPTRN